MKKTLLITFLLFYSIVSCTNRDGEIIDLINSVKKQNDDLKAQITALKKTTDSALVAVLKVNSLQATTDKKIDLIQTDLKALLTQIASLNTQMSALNADIGSLKTKIDALQAKCAELVAQIALLNGSSAQINLKEGLVAYYPFNGNAKDVSGNNLHGVVSGSVRLSADRNGKANSSYFFPRGYENLISIKHNEVFNFSREFTISLWFRFNEPWIYHAESLIYKTKLPFNYGWHIGVVQDDTSYGTQNYGLYFEVPNVQTFETLQRDILVNKWILVTYVFKNNIGQCYINGQASKSAQFTNINFNSLDNITLGSSVNPVSGTYLKDIDDVGFWNRALTVSEVNYLYSNGFNP